MTSNLCDTLTLESVMSEPGTRDGTLNYNLSNDRLTICQRIYMLSAVKQSQSAVNISLATETVHMRYPLRIFVDISYVIQYPCFYVHRGRIIFTSDHIKSSREQ